MTYDLFFKPRHGSFDRTQFAEYFRRRPHYEVNEKQALYGNHDTGACFWFELQGRPRDPEEEHLPVVFNINFFRPSFFIHEAEPEVAAFVRQFELLVEDPQVEGMGEGPYDKDRLLSGWNCGNDFAFSSLLGEGAIKRRPPSYPTAKLMDIWRWNYARSVRQAELGDARFVPRIAFVNRSGRIGSVVVWTDGIPAVIPEVDTLILVRRNLAAPPSGDGDCALLSWKRALPMLERYGTREAGNSLILDYDRAPRELSAFIRSAPSHAEELQIIRPEEVLERELVNKYARSSIGARILSLLNWRRAES
jgi:hypothetical protein